MSSPRAPLYEILSSLEDHYGPPQRLLVTDPFHLVLLENVGYLVDDSRREAAFEALRQRIGLEPEAILAAAPDTLISIARLGGIFAELRAERLKKSAEIALTEFDGDLACIQELGFAGAKKALTRFPDIGESGAERILLVSRIYPSLALDSNGLRVLVRLGYAAEDNNYSRMYREAQRETSGEVGEEFDLRIAAYQLLRRHGQELCKRRNPRCGECPLSTLCPSAGY
jgi:endonuclease III